MLAKPTVLILGAGASLAFGLPVGSKLATQIREMLDFHFEFGSQSKGSREIAQTVVRARRHDSEALFRQASVISRALPGFKSIDDCLHTHRSNTLGVLAGKMAIAEAIAAAERRSTIAPLWFGSQDEREQAKHRLWYTWAGQIVRMLVTGVDRETYPEVLRQLTVVSFNYDRCFASAVFHLLQNALDLSEGAAAEAMAGMSILHPYGSLGPLPYEQQSVPFGGAGDLIAAAQRLFIYTEEQSEAGHLQAIKDTVYDAERLLFLGFGFHQQNIDLMASPDRDLRGKEIFGTVKSEPLPAERMYRDRLANRIGVTGPITLEDLTCEELLSQYGVQLGG